jgi:hypothetical protein
MIRDTIARLRDGPEWRLEVADEAGNIRHLFRLIAETFDPPPPQLARIDNGQCAMQLMAR